MSVPWKSGGVDGQLFEHVTMVFIAWLMRSFVLDINGKKFIYCTDVFSIEMFLC